MQKLYGQSNILYRQGDIELRKTTDGFWTGSIYYAKHIDSHRGTR